MTYRAWDQTQGASGKLFAISATGGATAFSATEATVTLTITHVNHAPTWSGSGAALTPVLPGTNNPAGDSVASVFGSFFHDIDGNGVGVAVTGLTGTSGGVWQYSLDGGATWTNFGSVSLAAARLLAGSDLIRFVRNAGFNGPVTLTAYAWDQTSGIDGSTANLSLPGTTGGSTAFSISKLTASALVNSAPSL